MVMTEERPWAVLEVIYMERIAEIEAARDALWEKAARYQSEIVRLQVRVNELEASLGSLRS